MAVDEPTTIEGWSPRDDEDVFLGRITLQTALAKSINTVAARLADEVGRPAVARTAQRLGIVTPINTAPAMALGTSAVTPIEMASAYDTFADGGRSAPAYGMESIRTATGRRVWRRQPQAQSQVISNPALQELDQLLRAVVTDGTGVHAAIAGRDVAGKTGTTSDNRDAWFCGFTGGLTAVVWVGRDDAGPMQRVMGGGPPTALWREFMVSALRKLPPTPIPAGPAPASLPASSVTDPVTTLLSPTPPDTTSAQPPPYR